MLHNSKKPSLDSTYLILGCGNAPSVAQPSHLIALNVNVESFSACNSEIADGSDSLGSWWLFPLLF